MRTILSLLAAAALLGAGAAAALLLAPDRLQLVVDAGADSERAAEPPPPPDRTPEVLEAVDRVRTALAAFGAALDESASERDAIRGELSSLRASRAGADRTHATALAALSRELQAVRGSLAERPAAAPSAPPVEAPAAEAPVPEPATPEAEPAPAAPKRRSLAALLAERPASDVRDERARWTLSRGHCRVGFDGTSTIHNFTARSDAVEGSFDLHFHEPGDQPGGSLRLRVATLDSSNEDRDGEIHRHLAGDDGKAPEIRCEILSIEPVDARAADTRRVRARVRFHIHGKAHETDAPMVLEFTRQRLLHVKGEAKLDMSDFDIHPKAKLGVIKVDDEVTVWWDLYAEVDRADR